MNIDPTTLFLGPESLAELRARLTAMERERATAFTGLWCRETRFACVVETFEGAIGQFHIRGPLTADMAAMWLGLIEAEITAPPADRLH